MSARVLTGWRAQYVRGQANPLSWRTGQWLGNSREWKLPERWRAWILFQIGTWSAHWEVALWDRVEERRRNGMMLRTLAFEVGATRRIGLALDTGMHAEGLGCRSAGISGISHTLWIHGDGLGRSCEVGVAAEGRRWAELAASVGLEGTRSAGSIMRAWRNTYRQCCESLTPLCSATKSRWNLGW